MLKGDIDNSVLARWLVTLDVITDGKPIPKRRHFESWEKLAARTEIDRKALGSLWLISTRYAVRFELVIFDMPGEYRAAIEERMDIMAAHPVRYVTSYFSRASMTADIAYRPEVQYVLDLTKFAWTYGSRGIDLRGALNLG